MQFKQRRAGAATILDCAGVGNGLAAMPLKKHVEDALAAGQKQLIVNLAAVSQLDQVFLRGISSAYTAAQRAEGNLVVIGSHPGIKDALAKYGAGLWFADSEAAAMQQLFPGQRVISGDTQIAILGHDPFLDEAFRGISHYKERVTFHYFTNPGADLATIAALPPRAVFLHPQVGLPGIRTVRQLMSKLPDPVVLFGIGTPREQIALRAMVSQEGYDDYLELPFASAEIVIKGFDAPAFRQLLSKKLDLLLSGWYLERRQQQART